MADIPSGSSTTVAFPDPVYYGSSFSSDIDFGGDLDSVRINLTAGIAYQFYAYSDPVVGATSHYSLDDASGTVNFAGGALGGVLFISRFSYTPSASGIYLFTFDSVAASAGQWGLDVTGIAATDHVL